MGKIYSFQSPVHGQCGTTASMVAMAYAIKQEKKSIVLVHSQSSLAALENFFISGEEKRPVYDGIGLDYLCYTIKARDLEKNDLDKAMIHLDKDFFLLPSAAKRMDDEREEILKYIITEKLPLYYDYVFVDIGFGNSDVSQAVKEAADTNVMVISQNSMILTEGLVEENMLLLCGNYNPKRKLNLRAILPSNKSVIAAINKTIIQVL